MSDLSRITKQDVIDYRRQYYRPDNAVMVLAGGVDVEPTMALVTKYFGTHQEPAGRGPARAHRGALAGILPQGQRPGFQGALHRKTRARARPPTNPYVTILFHIPPIWHDDISPLYMLAQVISHRTGKMYMEMVLKNEHASFRERQRFRTRV